MTDRQRIFAENYAENGNATEAAKAAGYSHRTAYSQGQRLLKNVEVMQYIRQLQDTAARERLLSVVQVKAYLSDVIISPDEKTADKLKAADMYLKAAGEYLHIRPDPNDPGLYAVGEASGEDVVIYLPAVCDLADCETDGDDDPDALQTMEVNTPHEPTINPG